MNKSTKGMMIAASVASLLASGLVMADGPKSAAEAKIHCTGVNACKSHGECAGDGHGCAGANTCKGKGWVALSARECKEKGGSLAGEKKTSAPTSSAAASAPMK